MLFKALMASKWTTCFFTHIWFLALNISNYLHGIPGSNFPAFYEHSRSGQAYQLELQTPLLSHSILSRPTPLPLPHLREFLFLCHCVYDSERRVWEFYRPLQTFIEVSKAFLVFFVTYLHIHICGLIFR